MALGNQEQIQIQNRLYPAYYTQFHCLADRCRDTCCFGWKIQFNKRDYLKIKRAPKTPELVELTKTAVTRLPDGKRSEEHYGEFVVGQGKRCPFQNEQSLCRLQLDCGEKALPAVCQEFPRVHGYTPMGLEENLSTACEGVVELLWNLPEGLEFVEEPLPREKWRSCKDSPNNRTFPVLREAVIDLLQDRKYTLGQRMMMVGLGLDDIRKSWSTFDLLAWQRRMDLLRSNPSLLEQLTVGDGNKEKFLAENVRLALSLKEGGDPIDRELEEIGARQKQTDAGEQELEFHLEGYLAAERAFQNYFGDVEYFFENLVVNTAFWMRIPDLQSPETLWRRYVSLCSVYSFFRFLAVLCCGTQPSREKLFHGVVLASRALMHNARRQSALREQFVENKSDSLAHMAVLVQAGAV
ncbi:MAG: flagellin lysine-N-methylase [Lawsonibacter sp.]